MLVGNENIKDREIQECQEQRNSIAISQFYLFFTFFSIETDLNIAPSLFSIDVSKIALRFQNLQSFGEIRRHKFASFILYFSYIFFLL